MNKSKIIWLGCVPYDFTDATGKRCSGSTLKAVLITTDSFNSDKPEIVKVSPDHSVKEGMEGVCYYDKHGRLVEIEME